MRSTKRCLQTFIVLNAFNDPFSMCSPQTVHWFTCIYIKRPIIQYGTSMRPYLKFDWRLYNISVWSTNFCNIVIGFCYVHICICSYVHLPPYCRRGFQYSQVEGASIKYQRNSCQITWIKWMFWLEVLGLTDSYGLSEALSGSHRHPITGYLQIYISGNGNVKNFCTAGAWPFSNLKHVHDHAV